MIDAWWNSPGVWDEPYEMPAPFKQCEPNLNCYHFVAQSRVKCVIYHNPYVTQDGKRIDGTVEYDENGYWTFSVSWSKPMHKGRFVFHVETEPDHSADCEPTT